MPVSFSKGPNFRTYGLNSEEGFGAGITKNTYFFLYLPDKGSNFAEIEMHATFLGKN